MDRTLFAVVVCLAAASCNRSSSDESGGKGAQADSAGQAIEGQMEPAAVEDLPAADPKERFSNLSTGPDLVLLRIDSPKHEQTTVIMENTDVLFMLGELQKKEFLDEEYVEYMLANGEKTIHLSDEQYEKLVPEDEAVLLPEHAALKGKGRRFLVAKYMKKVSWSDDIEEGDEYAITFNTGQEMSGKEARSLARLLIEEGLGVIRDCESGFWYSSVLVPKGTEFEPVGSGD